MPEVRWGANVARYDHTSDALRYALYQAASRPTIFAQFDPSIHVRRSWWQRVKSRVSYWWWSHRPHLHFGPCYGGDDE